MAFIINGEQISDQAIEDEFESIKEHYMSLGEAVCCDRDEEFQQYARDNVTNRALMEQESISRFGPVEDADVDTRLAEVKKEHGGDQEFYDNTGFNLGDDKMIHQKLKSSMLVDRLLEDALGEEKPPTEEELKQFYQENIESYMSEEEVRVSQLFFEPDSHEAARDAFDNLRKIRREILAGADFEETAAKNSSKDKGEIDLGFMKKGDSMPEIESIVFSLEKDEISPIVATHFGFHMFKLVDRKEPTPVPFEQLQGIEEQFTTIRREKGINALIDELKEKGQIEEVEEEAVAD